jgi:uncharacterized membrane protein
MSSVPPSTPPPGGGSYTPPPPPPPGGAPAGGSSDRTLMVVLSYLWILALIPLLTKKDDREVQWHAKNGLAILIAEVVIWIALTAVGFFIPRGMGMGCGVGAIECVVWIAFLVVRIMCIVKGVNGQRFRVPVISDMADKW